MVKVVEEGLIVFESTHDSIKADNLCEERNFEVSLIPTHPSISLGCGFMLKTAWDKFNDLVALLEEEGVPYKALYYSQKHGIKRIVKKLEEK